MATFIMTGKYTADSVKQISDERTVEAHEIVKQSGGTITTAYVTLGQTDLVLIVEFPGVNEAMKASVALNKALGISFATIPALPVADFDKLVGGES